MIQQTIWYQVADVHNPSAEPYMVLRIDTSIRREGGVQEEVISLHWTRDEAEARATTLSRS